MVNRNNNWSESLDKIVFSTGPVNSYKEDSDQQETGITPSEQSLRIWLDKKSRKGKAVTLICNFVGPEDNLKELGSRLKKLCGVGGTVKDGEILIQGDHRNKVLRYLLENGYDKTKLAGGR